MRLLPVGDDGVRRCTGDGEEHCICRDRAPHQWCLEAGAWRETWLYVDSYLVILCECDTVLDIICEHQKGVWPNNKSVCEWDEAGENLTCTRCGIDAT